MGSANDKSSSPLRVCICCFPWATEAGYTHPLTTANILGRFCGEVLLVAKPAPAGEYTRPNIRRINLTSILPRRASIRPVWLSYPKWALKYMLLQLEMSRHIYRLANKVDVILLHEGPHFLLPALTAKLRRRKIVKYHPGGVIQFTIHPRFSIEWFASYLFMILENLVNLLAHRVVLATECKDEAGIIWVPPHRISAAMYSYLSDAYFEKKAWRERKDIVGYVGRLVPIKGVLELARAIPLVLAERDVRFVIVGEGILKTQMQEYLAEAGCLDRVDFIGWVNTSALPDYFNEMKFHVLPTYADYPGLVNLEAMACGAVAIANKVGGIPSIMKDRETGFLMNGNDPETICRSLLEAWDHPDLELIRANGSKFAREFLSFEKVAEDWRAAVESTVSRSRQTG